MKTFITKFADIIEVDAEQLTPEFDLVNGSDWDSLAFISTMVLADKCFGVVLESTALEQVRTFSDLLDLLHQQTELLQEAA